MEKDSYVILILVAMAMAAGIVAALIHLTFAPAGVAANELVLTSRSSKVRVGEKVYRIRGNWIFEDACKCVGVISKVAAGNGVREIRIQLHPDAPGPVPSDSRFTECPTLGGGHMVLIVPGESAISLGSGERRELNTGLPECAWDAVQAVTSSLANSTR